MLIISFSACKKSTEYQPSPNSSGYFILTPMQLKNDLQPVTKQTSDEPIPIFYLGEMKDSREYYFILTNGGEESIFDINLSSSVPAFQITPARIGSLAGKTTISSGVTGGFIPLITLGVTHGTRLNGLGYASLLPMNLNIAIITISGKTLKNGDTISIIQQIEMQALAKIMDIRVFDGLTEINLEQPDGGVGYLGPMGVKDYRWYNLTHTSFEIENTGNIPITISTYERSMFVDSVRIEPGFRKTLTIANVSEMNALVFDGKGTITYPERIELFENGKGCFVLTHFNK